MPDDIKDLFAGIPENAKICIWGAANAGRSIKEELAKYRQDTTVCAFIDSVKQGEIDGVKIYKPENMPEIKNNFDYMIISTRSDCTVIDAMLFYYDIKIYAFELIYDKVKNKSIAHIIDSLKELEIIPLALWDRKEKLVFTENVAAPYSSGINPPLNKNGSEQNFTVDAISIDEYVSENNIEKIDFIKMDIEGAEMKALKGAEQTLIKFRPQLAISIYHSNNDMQDIPIYLHNILKNYIFKIGQYSPDNDETILYAIPEELYVK